LRRHQLLHGDGWRNPPARRKCDLDKQSGKTPSTPGVLNIDRRRVNSASWSRLKIRSDSGGVP